jgi:hypothetical protein
VNLLVRNLVRPVPHTTEIGGQLDLHATPAIEWRWTAVELPACRSRRKATDDQAAELFVV